MNPFSYYYSPMNAFRQGYAMGDAMDATAERERQRLIAEKERAALSQMGQGANYFGFEQDPNAARPAFLKELYQSNPHAALEIEQRMAAPFVEARQATKAGEIEKAKLAARVTAWGPFMNDGESGGPPQPMPANGPPVNAFSSSNGAPTSVGLVSEGGVTAPGGAILPNPQGAGSTTDTLMGKGLGSASRTKKTRKFSLEHGPSVEFEQIPEFEAEKARIEAAQKGRQVELEAQRTGDTLNNSRMAEVNKAHGRVFELNQAISGLQEKIDAGTRNPRQVQQELARLGQERDAAAAYRDSLLRGNGQVAGDPATAQLTPDEQAQAAAVRATKGRVPSGTAPKAALPSSSVGSGLPYKQAVETRQKAMEGTLTQARGLIDAAHSAANAALQNKPATDRIMELLSKSDLGNRLFKLPGGETAATVFSGNYDELNKWRSSLILQEKNEGESQLYNTLPELKIHSASLPSVDNDENTNRRAIVPVKNLMEARLVAPQFLEQWASQHGGSLDGARQAFRSWMQHNPMYQTQEKNGAVSIHENTHFIPLDIWGRLRQRFDEKTILKKRDSGGIQIIGEKVFLKD